MIGLSRVAFAHEDPIFRTEATWWAPESRRQPFELAVDAVDVASAHLEEQLAREQQHRRRPTYWIDRGLRAVLGFPAYLISVLLGFDRRELAPGRARALWTLSVAIEAGALIVGLGSSLGWWS